MANRKAQTQSATIVETPKRGRGRPATFPGVDLVAFPVNVPHTVRDQARELSRRASKGKGQNLNLTIANLISRAFEASERSRQQAADRKAAKTAVKAEQETSAS